MTCPPGDDPDDAARWWRAYVLAESDQVDELRKLAAAGDDHARRQLATWLSDRAFSVGLSDRDKVEEAIGVIRPLADAGDDVAELWLARWLADCDHLDELRRRADAGSHHAGRLLASRLAAHDLLDELRQRADSGSYLAWRELIKTLAGRDMRQELREFTEAADADRLQLIFAAADEAGSDGIGVLRLLADLGDKTSRLRLAHRLAREGALGELRQRAADGSAGGGSGE
ncbi:MAG: hypothetical protein ACRDN0_19755 [Trebonia sp.]